MLYRFSQMLDLTRSFCTWAYIILKETGGEYRLEEVAREHICICMYINIGKQHPKIPMRTQI